MKKKKKKSKKEKEIGREKERRKGKRKRKERQKRKKKKVWAYYKKKAIFCTTNIRFNLCQTSLSKDIYHIDATLLAFIHNFLKYVFVFYFCKEF